jgi:hypothetical protein
MYTQPHTEADTDTGTDADTPKHPPQITHPPPKTHTHRNTDTKNRTNRKQHFRFICCKQKTEVANFRLFAANRKGKQKFVFFVWQMINGNQ